jgi:hypothetical protein
MPDDQAELTARLELATPVPLRGTISNRKIRLMSDEIGEDGIITEVIVISTGDDGFRQGLRELGRPLVEQGEALTWEWPATDSREIWVTSIRLPGSESLLAALGSFALIEVEALAQTDTVSQIERNRSVEALEDRADE